MIASVVMLMMLLCGCRTRITNNTEVADVMTDDSGWLQESYQVRRDELGIPVAEPPLFKGTRSDDEDYDDAEDYDDLDWEDADDESIDEDEDLDEEEDVENESRTRTTTTRTQSSTSTSTTRPVRRTPVRRTTQQPTKTQTTTVKVTFNLNASDAKCSRTSMLVKKGSTYGSLPTPTRSGYDFEGWYTSKSGGSKVTSKTKVTTDKAHTIYAHWKETEKKKYTITFDGNGEGDDVELSSTEMTVEEGGKYGSLPSAKREKYKFSGWFTDPSGGSQITSGTKFTANEDQTLYAQWEFDPYTWWENEFTKAANEVDKDSQQLCLVENGDESEEGLVKDCRGSIAKDDAVPDNIIKFIKNFDEDAAFAEADAIMAKYSETAPDARVIIVSDRAFKGGKEEKLLYKMMLFEVLNGSVGDIEEAAYDLTESDTSGIYPYVYPTE